jgi:hypothetical protein
VEGKSSRLAIGTPRGLSSTAGTLAVGAWLYDRGIYNMPTSQWRVEITLDHARDGSRGYAEALDTRFQLFILPDEWGYFFSHAGRVSRIRVTDLVHTELRDDHDLASVTPPLRRIGTLVRRLEHRFAITLPRYEAGVATTLPGSEPSVRAWVDSL